MKRGPKPKSLKERFESSYAIMPSGCWEWQKSTNDNGYGNFWTSNKTRMPAHRYSYELYVKEIGPWNTNNQINHKCHNRLCVNPNHLYNGTQTQNMQDLRERKKYEIA